MPDRPAGRSPRWVVVEFRDDNEVMTREQAQERAAWLGAGLPGSAVALSVPVRNLDRPPSPESLREGIYPVDSDRAVVFAQFAHFYHFYARGGELPSEHSPHDLTPNGQPGRYRLGARQHFEGWIVEPTVFAVLVHREEALTADHLGPRDASMAGDGAVMIVGRPGEAVPQAVVKRVKRLFADRSDIRILTGNVEDGE